ncbi:hypothetical protein F5J12DRAFT_781066 [Pisolithus orientalis]|uniref:uncharacterized protein n=1 Tax=Pisolithus orientalis TaxID=936130 RepID=UPI002223FD25|nr:uncharacterized protein F5J12DRAFT_781066 [Pisolithus orientalis]KAI6020042.1 hypothetical protein F5J12DRAFT_781066 [Pisolithus orientalis]
MANSWETAKSSECDNGIGTSNGDLASGINVELNDAGVSERLTGGDWNGGGDPQGGSCNGIPGATGSGDLSHASSSNRVLSERCVDMESQGGSTNGLLEEGDGANDSHAGSIKGDLGKPADWKEGSILVHHWTSEFTTLLKHPPPAHQSFTNNIQLVITTENAKQMVKEAARVTMQALRGLWGWDTKHWGKAAQLVWAQLGMVQMVVEHLPLAFKIPPHLIAIDMHMVDPATIFAMQMWPPFNQMMMA